GIRVARVRGTDELPPPLAHQPVLAHQPGNPLARGGQPLSPECRVYPERSVATAAPAVSCAHVDAQTLVRSHSRRTSTRCLACHGVVEAAPAHLEQPAHEPHREQAPVSIDGGVPVAHRDSFAKYAAALFRKATSWRSLAFSRSSLLTASWSLGSRPWPGNTSDTAAPWRASTFLRHSRS